MVHDACFASVCVWCVHACVCARLGWPSCSHCASLSQRPGGAGVPVHVAVSYLGRNYPWCVRFICDESYKDNFFLSIKSCLGGLLGPCDQFHKETHVSTPLGAPARLGAGKVCSGSCWGTSALTFRTLATGPSLARGRWAPWCFSDLHWSWTCVQGSANPASGRSCLDTQPTLGSGHWCQLPSPPEDVTNPQACDRLSD